MEPTTPYSSHELADEALDAARLLACRRCDTVTAHQIEAVQLVLPGQRSLSRVRCQVCQRGQLALLTA